MWIDLSPPFRHNKMTYVMATCQECGQRKRVSLSAIRKSKSKSCGCAQADYMRKKQTSHGRSRTADRVYFTWRNMRLRCSPKAKGADRRNYYERGIRVCEAWQSSFETFLHDVGEPKAKSDRLERKNNNTGYEPGNCIWVSAKVQARNRRTNVFIEYQGRTQILSDWADELGVPRTALSHRIRQGWPLEIALAKKQP